MCQALRLPLPIFCITPCLPTHSTQAPTLASSISNMCDPVWCELSPVACVKGQLWIISGIDSQEIIWSSGGKGLWHIFIYVQIFSDTGFKWRTCHFLNLYGGDSGESESLWCGMQIHIAHRRSSSAHCGCSNGSLGCWSGEVKVKEETLRKEQNTDHFVGFIRDAGNIWQKSSNLGERGVSLSFASYLFLTHRVAEGGIRTMSKLASKIRSSSKLKKKEKKEKKCTFQKSKLWTGPARKNTY